jgi:hypothetical protein
MAVWEFIGKQTKNLPDVLGDGRGTFPQTSKSNFSSNKYVCLFSCLREDKPVNVNLETFPGFALYV